MKPDNFDDIVAALGTAPEFDSRTREFSEAIYAAAQLGMLPKGVGGDDAVKIWRIVESVKNNGFPKECWMTH